MDRRIINSKLLGDHVVAKILLNAFFFLTFAAVSVNASPVFTSEPTQVITNDGHQLNAIWTFPQGNVNAAALIIQGSGNVGSDGDVSGPFLGTGYQGQSAKLSEEITNALASVGVATLRYAKRGVDDPTQLPNQKFPYLVDDAESAFKMLQNKFPNTKSIVIGFSEGGLIASILSTHLKSDALFLLAPALRPIDNLFHYQFVEWPVELLKSNLKQDSAGFIQASSFSENSVSNLPLIGQPWNVIDSNHDKQISVVDELIPAYQAFYSSMRGLLATPQFSGWYESLKALPAFSQFASQIKAPVITLYQGMDDAQVRWSWTAEDMSLFPVIPTLHFFSNAGHCFAPMEGSIGEVKTSGPFSSQLLEQLASDVQVLLTTRNEGFSNSVQ